MNDTMRFAIVTVLAVPATLLPMNKNMWGQASCLSAERHLAGRLEAGSLTASDSCPHGSWSRLTSTIDHPSAYGRQPIVPLLDEVVFPGHQEHRRYEPD
jgi:hypothetical protein